MDRDYDFESANAKFDKAAVAQELTPSAEQLLSALEEAKFYDKKSSFFDNISCENKDRGGETSPVMWKWGEERKLNMETFGQVSVDGGRGGYRGYRGRGWRGRGRAQWRGGSRSTTTQDETGV
jgi:protein LSM14